MYYTIKMKNSQYFGRLTKHLRNPEKYTLPEGGEVILNLLETSYKDYPIDEAFYMMYKGLKGRPINKCGHEKRFESGYRKYVETCPVCGRKAYNKTKVQIDGVEYKSITYAMKTLGLSHEELHRKITSEEELNKRIIKKYSHITKDFLDEEFNRKRTTIKEISRKLNEKQTTISSLMRAHGLSTTWKQLTQRTYDFLNDKDRFRTEFEISNSVELASKYDCSSSTILQTADKYGIDRTSRFQSSVERELVSFLRELDSSLVVIERDRQVLNGMEIDIYLPDYNLGIELDGLYYHTDQSVDDNRNKHSEKQKLAYKNGVLLLRFVDIGETKDKLSIVKSMICSKLGYTQRIGARKCVSKEVQKEEVISFLNENSLTRFDFDKAVGLYYEEELVQCVTFDNCKISNYCTKQNLTVVGGLSKILKNSFVNDISVEVNLRFSNGKCFRKIGFSYGGYLEPRFFITNMKENVYKKCDLDDAFENGWRRYKDCGYVLMRQ